MFFNDIDDLKEYLITFFIAIILVVLIVRAIIGFDEYNKKNPLVDWREENKINIEKCKNNNGIPVTNNLYGQLTNCIYLK